jgi:hypothetical protein
LKSCWRKLACKEEEEVNVQKGLVLEEDREQHWNTEDENGCNCTEDRKEEINIINKMYF